ncbi:fructokinase [Salinibacterium sp. CAN_S4]|uniref:carbohydrate kinase family protein n=1 Tax=Salinibacterium sp. CAN_S4 TaxID=2787727 RepID=UPI0018F05224
MIKPVLVVGEALTDVVVSDGHSREHPGGSPMNVSFGLGRLDVPVVFASRLGADDRGRAIERHLRDAGVELEPGLLEGQSTSSATVTLDSSGAAEYDFDVEWSLDVAGLDPQRFDHVHFGSIGAFLEPGAATVRHILAKATESASISFDPNIRPQFLHDHAAAVEATERHLAVSDVVKASDEDVEWLYPGSDLRDAAARWLESGPSLVIITKGSGGSIVVTRSDSFDVPSLTVTVADTIGAGDSFMAGLIDGLASRNLLGASRRAELSRIDRATMTEIVERATLCASITVSRFGANPPTLADLAVARD